MDHSGGSGGGGGSGGSGGSGRTLDCSTGPLTQLWTYDPSDDYQLIQAAPSLDPGGNAVMVECDAPRIHCHLVSLDPAGRVRFSKNTTIPAAPVIIGQIVVLAFGDTVELRDLSSGTFLVQLQFPGEAISRVVEGTNGNLVLATTVGVAGVSHVQVRGIRSGQVTYNVSMDGGNVPVMVSDADGHVFGSVDDTHVFQLDDQGQVLWSTEVTASGPVAALGSALLLESCALFDLESRAPSMALGDPPCTAAGSGTAAFVLHGSTVDAIDPATGSAMASVQLPAAPEPQVLLLTSSGTVLVPVRDDVGGKLLEVTADGQIRNSCTLPTEGISFHAALGQEKLLYRSESTAGGTSIIALDLPGISEPATGWTTSTGSSRHSEHPR